MNRMCSLVLWDRDHRPIHLSSRHACTQSIFILSVPIPSSLPQVWGSRGSSNDQSTMPGMRHACPFDSICRMCTDLFRRLKKKERKKYWLENKAVSKHLLHHSSTTKKSSRFFCAYNVVNLHVRVRVLGYQ